jgi:hypothetical protein
MVTRVLCELRRAHGRPISGLFLVVLEQLVRRSVDACRLPKPDSAHASRSDSRSSPLLAAAVKLTVVAGENLTVGSTVWLPAESVAPGR